MCTQTSRSLAVGGLVCFALLAAGCADQAPPLEPESATPLAAAGGPHVVQVAPPTGIVAEDRASILAAVDEVRPGGTVQFAPGTYVIGLTDGSPDFIERDQLFILVTQPRITLQGHPDGTTIRGCELAAIEFYNCAGLELSGGRQTVHGLAFENFSWALVVGQWPFPDPAAHRVGGYRVEDNDFRVTYVGVTMFGEWQQPAVMGGNRFVDVGTGVYVLGRTAHVLDNTFSVVEPSDVPVFGYPFTGIYATDGNGSACDRNVFAGNRIDAHENGILIDAYTPGVGCRHNVVRDNTITNSTEYEPLRPAWAIGISNASELVTGVLEDGLIEDNLVQGNRILGSEGQGVVLYASERNRIVNNTITDVTMTDPFPPEYGAGNGTGVWVSLQSRENQILNNTFAAIESHEVVLEGDRNHVATRSRSDVVRDLGVGNRVTGPGSVVTSAAPARTGSGTASVAAERAGAARTLQERFGARGPVLEGMRRQEAPR